MADLDREIETYRSRLPELLKHAGKHVLIHGAEVEGIFDTYADALKVGYSRHFGEAFLVKRIAPAGQGVFMPFNIGLPCRA